MRGRQPEEPMPEDLAIRRRTPEAPLAEAGPMPDARDAARRARVPAYAGSAAALAVVLAAAHAGCGPSDSRDYFVIPFDAGAEAGEPADTDAPPDIDPTLGGPCT